MKFAYTITPGAVTLYDGGRVRQIPASAPNYARLVQELRKAVHDVPLIRELADIVRFIAKVTMGEVQLSDTEVRWKGEPVHGVIADRILEMLSQGFDLEPLVNFLNRVMLNPSKFAQEELYQWLEAGNMPITPDGCFLAFKAVSPNFRDKYTGTMDNSVGKIVEMDRDKCDPNRNNHCSTGLHFCSPGYLPNFASPHDPIMVVKVDPTDVTAIPSDYHHHKGRTCRYEVLAQVPPEEVVETFFKGRMVNNDYKAQVVGNDPAPAPVAQIEEPKVEEPVVETPTDELAEAKSAGFVFLDTLNMVVQNPADAINKAMTDGVAKPGPLSAAVKTATKTSPKPAPTGDFVTTDGRIFTEADIQSAFTKAGSIRGAARALDVAKSTLQGWMKRIDA